MRSPMGPPMGGPMGDMGGPGTISPGPMSGHGPGGPHPDSPLGGGGGGGPPNGMGGTVPMGPSSHPLLEPSSPHPYGMPR